MNWTALGRRARSEAGNALVELAVALPLLVLTLIGTADFARVFYTSIELTNAARAGAQYGAASIANSSNAANMLTTATSSVNITGVTAAAAPPVCQCFTSAGGFVSTVSCTASAPCGGDHRVMTVTVTTQKSFTTIANFLGVAPWSRVIVRSATLRVSE